MKLAIIIPTKNEEETLPRLICSIREQTFKDFKIIVADADSKDKTREIAKKYGCEVVKGGTLSEGRNNGAAKAIKENLEYLMFIDADAVLSSKYFLEQALKEFRERKLGIAGTLQIPLYSNSKIDMKKVIGTCKRSKDIRYNALYGITNILLKLLQHTQHPCTQNCIFIRRDVHEDIGGFKLIDFGEDSECSKSAVKRGHKFGILIKPKKIFTSTRRLESKGFLKMVGIYLYFNAGRLLFNHEFFSENVKKSYYDL
jgi:glycosyltransferase involved in cell wall biosynthesis